MGSANGMIWRWSVATFMALIVYVVPARAFVTTERSSSIIIFPKVVSDFSGVQSFPEPGAPAGVSKIGVDTIIQISNTSNSMVFAHCFYVNATPTDPTRRPGPDNSPVWIETDFDIALTKQQPTHWLVSTGRITNPLDNKPCPNCSNAGFDPGYQSIVPPVDDPFVGELKCIEVDSSGTPLNGNHLKGEATIVTRDGKGDASKYDAIGVLGLNTNTNTNNGDTTLRLGGGGAEYTACPETLILNHFAENASDPVIEELGNGPSRVNTELTLVPCSEDFENQSPTSVTVQFEVTNEFERMFSASTTVTCWANLRLSAIGNIGQIFDVEALGSRFAQTQITASDTEPGGIVGVAEEFHQTPKTSMTPATARTALNLHGQGDRPNADLIIIPENF